MSYILDALRRADADRDRGAVPGLNAQPAPMLATTAARASLWPWIVCGGLAMAFAAAIGGWLLRAAPVAEPRVAAAASAEGVAIASSSVSMAAPKGPASTAVPAPAPAPTLAASPASAVSPASPASGGVAMAPPASGRVPEGPAVLPPQRLSRAATRTSSAFPPTVAARSASAASAPSSQRVFARTELPAEVQRDLPELVVGGATYSENPASRMLIVNGQIFREGDALAPGVMLRQIQLKSAVLEYKGYRYGIGF